MKLGQILAISLLWCWAAFAQASLEPTPAETEVLEVIRSRAMVLNQGSGTLLRALEDCHKFIVDESLGFQAKEPLFVESVKSVTGRTLDTTYSCKKLFSLYFGYGDEKYFRVDFRTMQLHALLAQSGQSRFWVHAETLDGNYADKLKAFDHPIKLRGTAQLPLEKPDPVVWKRAFEMYQDSIRSNCQKFIKTQKERLANLIGEHPSSPFFDSLCEYLPYKFMRGPGAKELLRKDHPKVFTLWKEYIHYARVQRRLFQEHHLKRYSEEIETNPHFLLLPGRKLTLTQIRKVILTMKDHQLKSKKELASLQGRKLLQVFPFYDSFKKIIDGILLPSTSDSYLKLRGWSDKKIHSTVASLRKKHMARESIKSGAQLLGAIGSMVACTLIPPQTKALGVITMGLGRGACYFFTGAGWEVYFQLDALHAKSKTFQEFTQSPDSEYLYKNYNELNSTNREAVMALLFLPLGIQPKVTKSVIRNTLKLLK